MAHPRKGNKIDFPVSGLITAGDGNRQGQTWGVLGESTETAGMGEVWKPSTV